MSLHSNDICEWADTLRRLLPSNVDRTHFLTWLHQYIENRSWTMALLSVIDRSLGSLCELVRPPGQHWTLYLHTVSACVGLLGHCLDIMQEDLEKLKTSLRQFRL